jgi:hypothetical protein
VLDSVNLGSLVARCNLAAAHEGMNAIRVQPDFLQLPLGLVVEGIAPREVSVRLTASPPAKSER